MKRLVDLYLAVPDLSANHIDHQFTLNPYRLLKLSGRQINLYRTLQFCNLLMLIQKEIEIPVCHLDLYRPKVYRATGFDVGDRSFKRSEEHTSELQSRGHLVC